MSLFVRQPSLSMNVPLSDVETKRRRGLFTRLLYSLGPGLFLVAYTIGTGSVTTMASAGSRWGMSLAWTAALSCLFTYIGVWAFSRYTLLTGHTILHAVHSRLPAGRLVSLFLLVSVILAEFAGVTGLTAIVVDLLRHGVQTAFGWSGPEVKLVVTLLLATPLFWILWTGSYATLEKFMAILVGVMGLSFLATAAMVVPSWLEILGGLVPRMPEAPGAELIVAGMVGTSFSSAVLYCRSITVREKGWKMGQGKQARRDALISVVALFLLSAAVMVCAAGTLHRVGRPVEDTVDMIRTLEPLMGDFAHWIFILGIAGAGFSSLIPTILIGPWLLADYRNQPLDPRSKQSRMFVSIGVLVALIGPYLETKPVTLMIVTMALLAIILPLSMVAITWLLNQGSVLGRQRNTPLWNAACVAAILFSIVMSYYGVIGLLEFLG